MSEQLPAGFQSRSADRADGREPFSPTPIRSGFPIVLALAAGLVAGIGSWAIGEATLTTFRPPLERLEVMGQVIVKATYQDQSAADFKNATLSYTLLGIVLGCCLGFAGGLARGSMAPGLKAALAGAVLAGSFAACASLAFLPIYFQAKARAIEELARDLVLPTVINGGIWMAAGLGGGLAFGLGLGGGKDCVTKTALGGMMGAAVAAVLCQLLSATVFPTSKVTSALPPDWLGRLLARLILTVLVGICAAMFLTLSVSRPAKRAGTP